MVVHSSNFFQDFDIIWGEGRGKILNNGDLLTLTLDNYSGSGFQSKSAYLFGKIDMQLKLVPLREFKNLESKGVPFPKSQPMKLYSSIWNADEWATRGGLIKTDWAQAPFTASYRNFNADACVVPNGVPASATCTSAETNNWLSQNLDPISVQKLKWVQKNNMIYNYCTDTKRFPQGLAPECNAY